MIDELARTLLHIHHSHCRSQEASHGDL